MTTSLVTVKCVLCYHVFTVPLTSEAPVCPKCFGPVTVEKVEVKPDSKADQLKRLREWIGALSSAHRFVTLSEWRSATNEQRREWSAIGTLIRG